MIDLTVDGFELAFQPVEPLVDFLERLFGFRFKRQQVLVNGLDLLRQETERAFAAR